MKLIISIIIGITLLFCKGKAFSQNGYRLEFEDVITLSVDTLKAPAIGIYTKSYTVPTGTVLKINSGRLSLYCEQANAKVYTGFLKINENLIVGADSATTAFTSSSGTGSLHAFILRLTPETPIWAPANSTVVLGVEVVNTKFSTLALHSNWISGVLFRKVPN